MWAVLVGSSTTTSPIRWWLLLLLLVLLLLLLLALSVELLLPTPLLLRPLPLSLLPPLLLSLLPPLLILTPEGMPVAEAVTPFTMYFLCTITPADSMTE